MGAPYLHAAHLLLRRAAYRPSVDISMANTGRKTGTGRPFQILLGLTVLLSVGSFLLRRRFSLIFGFPISIRLAVNKFTSRI